MNWVKHPIYNLYANEQGQIKGARETLRKARKDRYGYLRINIHNPVEKKRKTVHIHRLIAECFELPGEGTTIDHIDGNKENNSVNNLQHCSPSENCSLHFKRGLHPKSKTVVIDGVTYWSKREAARILNLDRNKL